jgi:hypothetical protein
MKESENNGEAKGQNKKWRERKNRENEKGKLQESEDK